MDAPVVRKVVITGGGTAGWNTAAALVKHFGELLEIALVESEEIGTVGVGEATFPSILGFHRLLKLDEREFMRASKATFKLGISFENWGAIGDRYIHAFGQIGKSTWMGDFHHFWLAAKEDGFGGELGDYCFERKAAEAGKFSTSDTVKINYAYHFDAGLYAVHLRRISEGQGVKRIEGKIARVEQHPETGFITALVLESGEQVTGDLFVDCSGFRGLLIEQTLKSGYDDWSHWLPCNRATAVPCDRQPTITPYTRSHAREAGWQWRIPLQHRTGNGYVYCSEFLSDDEAAGLLLSRLDGTPRADPRPLRFVAGKRKEPWKKNCVALGLASGFLEPLESTSIHLIQTAIAKLLFLLPRDHIDPAVIDKYNAMLKVELEEIRDFLVLHYTATERNDTPFWRHCQNIRKPDSLKQKWQMYQHSAVLVAPPGELFRESSWFAVFTGQNVIPKTWHPSADIPPNEELERRLQLISSDVRKRIEGFPTHDEYIRMHCAAPAMPAKPMMEKAM